MEAIGLKKVSNGYVVVKIGLYNNEDIAVEHNLADAAYVVIEKMVRADVKERAKDALTKTQEMELVLNYLSSRLQSLFLEFAREEATVATALEAAKAKKEE